VCMYAVSADWDCERCGCGVREREKEKKASAARGSTSRLAWIYFIYPLTRGDQRNISFCPRYHNNLSHSSGLQDDSAL
jgi:hypothetical protein